MLLLGFVLGLLVAAIGLWIYFKNNKTKAIELSDDLQLIVDRIGENIKDIDVVAATKLKALLAKFKK